MKQQIMVPTHIDLFASSHLEHPPLSHSFADIGREVLNLFQDEIASVLYTSKSLSTTITSHTIESGMQWPEVVVPHFELQGTSLAELAEVAQMNIVPLVNVPMVEEWQAFSVENQGWIEDGLKLHNESVTVDKIIRFVYHVENDKVVAQTGPGVSGYYSPVWQQYPAPSDPTVVNFDLLSLPNITQHFIALLETNSPIVSRMLNLDFLLQREISDTDSAKHTFMMQPLYPDFSKTEVIDMVGYILTVVAWEDIFAKIIRLDEEGLTIVVSNTCGDSLTYQTATSETIIGDIHDGEFDDLALSVDMRTLLDDSAYQGGGHCAYSATVYPTSDLENKFLSNAPLLYGAMAILLFFFTTGKFSREALGENKAELLTHTYSSL